MAGVKRGSYTYLMKFFKRKEPCQYCVETRERLLEWEDDRKRWELDLEALYEKARVNLSKLSGRIAAEKENNDAPKADPYQSFLQMKASRLSRRSDAV